MWYISPAFGALHGHGADIPIMLRKFDLASGRITDPSLTEDQVFLNFFPYTLQDCGARLEMLRQARDQANTLMQAIEHHLDA